MANVRELMACLSSIVTCVIEDMRDGTSHTALISETLLGPGGPDVANVGNQPQYYYAKLSAGPLTASLCDSNVGP